jgi:hypothetical protein
MNKLFSCGQSYCDTFYIFILYFKHTLIVLTVQTDIARRPRFSKYNFSLINLFRDILRQVTTGYSKEFYSGGRLGRARLISWNKNPNRAIIPWWKTSAPYLYTFPSLLLSNARNVLICCLNILWWQAPRDVWSSYAKSIVFPQSVSVTRPLFCCSQEPIQHLGARQRVTWHQP